MVVIENGVNHFTLNGEVYTKIYQASTAGVDSIVISNINIRNQNIINSTKYTDIQVDGITYGTRSELLIALIPVLYTEKLIIDNTTYDNTRITASLLPPSGVPNDGDEWIIYKTN